MNDNVLPKKIKCIKLPSLLGRNWNHILDFQLNNSCILYAYCIKPINTIVARVFSNSLEELFYFHTSICYVGRLL